jgi:hypothetical protein
MEKTVTVCHNHGFFSNCSIRLDCIINYYNLNNYELPNIVDSSQSYIRYREPGTERDFTFDCFEHYNNVSGVEITTKTKVDYIENYQYNNYKTLDYESIIPFVKKYFTPSLQIKKIISDIETKYAFGSYDNICALFYRGNDKVTESPLCPYEDIIERAKNILIENPSIKFLIQSDETEFIERMRSEFPSNSFWFNDEIRHMNKQSSSVDHVFSDKNHQFSKYYLAITNIMSKCKYVICGSSGNCSIWITFYRGGADNIIQYMKGTWA